MPKIVDHEKYRNELLVKCFDLLSTKGYSNITMREIAENLGISTGSLYHYFQNKQAILDQLFQMVSRQNVGEAVELLQDEESLEQKLIIFEDFCKRNIDHYQKLFLLAVDFTRNSTLDGAPDTLHNFLNYYVKTIKLHFGISWEKSSSIVVYVIGLVCQSLLAPRTVDFDGQMTILKNIVLGRVEFTEDNT